MVTETDLRAQLEEINKKREEVRRTKERRRILPLSWERHVRKAIGYMFRYREFQIPELVDKLKIHVKDIDHILGILEGNGLVIREENKLRITGNGEEFAEELGFKIRCEKGQDYRAFPPGLRKRLVKEVEEFLIREMDPPDPYLFQWFFTPNSVLEIIEYMIDNFDVEGRKIACLMTPTIGLALHLTGYAKDNEIYVIEKDKAILQILENHNVQTILWDVTEPILNNERWGYFDCVIADPPYDEDFYFVSLSRALELLGGRQDRVVYVVTPPPEIAYLRRPGFPPLITSIISILDRCGLLLEEIKKGICQYLSPPYEIATLSRRLKLTKEQANKILTTWRSSDLLKASIFRDVTSPLPIRCEIRAQALIKYERYKRRFLVRQEEIKSYKEFTYQKPELKTEEAMEWDRFKDDGEFIKPLSAPYFVLIHDIGDWDDPANRLIKLEGAVAHYLWQIVKSHGTLNTKVIQSIKKEFLNTPEVHQIEGDVKDFILNLKKLNLLNGGTENRK
jgi:predicted methyltransferase